MQDVIETVFGRFVSSTRGRLELTYDYETAAISSFKQIARQINAKRVLDIGANIGVYSIYCADLPNLDAIDAYEPSPASFALLEKNVSIQNNRNLFNIHRVAASSTAAKVAFRIVSPLSGANAIIDEDGDAQDVVHVDARAIDDDQKSESSCVAIKIDVEGHELNALCGMRKFLTNNHCYLQVESLRKDRIDAVMSFMKELDYRYIFSLRDDHLFLHQKLNVQYENIMAILAKAVSKDLRDLMHLRREKRSIALAARKLRDMSGYRTDPLLLGEDESPFA